MLADSKLEELSLSSPWRVDPGPERDDRHLFAWWRTHAGFNCNSIPERSIDLYADMVTRHQAAEFKALTYQIGSDTITLSYEQLDAEVCRLHSQWSATNLTPGAGVVIATRNPLTRIIALLAAIRAGLVPTLLLNKGLGRSIQEIFWVDPALIHADRDLAYALPEDLRSRCLPLEGRVDSTPERAGHQAPDSPALQFFNPYKQGPEGVQSLTAGSLFANLLRDSSLVLGLKRSSRIATFRGYGPPSPFIELCALFAGCHYLSLDPDGAEVAQNLCLGQELDLIHLPLTIAKKWQSNPPASVPKWDCWIKDALEAIEITSWASVVVSLKINEIPSASLHWSLQTGTVILSSLWTHSVYDLDLLPAPGVPWHLGELKSPDTEAKMGFGLYCQMIGKEEDSIAVASPLMLARNGDAYRLLGTTPKGRSGVAFPERIACIALSLETAWHVIVAQESLSEPDGIEYVLLAFMDPRTPTEIQTILEREVGPDGVPHQICIIPLLPRFDDDGMLDFSWIKRNFLNGDLERRATSPVYKALSAFKLAILNNVFSGKEPSTLNIDLVSESSHDH